jgi:hypothetical protein
MVKVFGNMIKELLVSLHPFSLGYVSWGKTPKIPIFHQGKLTKQGLIKV